MFKENKYISRTFQTIIDQSIKNIQVLVRGHEMIISLASFPEYMTDTILCELIKDFRTNFKQIIPKGINITLVSENLLTEQDAQAYADLVRQTFQGIKTQLLDLETQITSSVWVPAQSTYHLYT